MSIIKKITLIRHAECISNVQKIFQSTSDPLTNTGITQAQQRGPILSSQTFDCVYSSTAVRTLQTLLYAVANGLHITNNYIGEPLMLEIDRGIYAGTTETPEKRAEVNAITDMLTGRPEGGESVMDVWNRVAIMRQRLMESNDKDILLVGHSGWFKYFITQTQGGLIEDALQMKSLGHDQLCVITISEDGAIVEYQDYLR